MTVYLVWYYDSTGDVDMLDVFMSKSSAEERIERHRQSMQNEQRGYYKYDPAKHTYRIEERTAYP